MLTLSSTPSKRAGEPWPSFLADLDGRMPSQTDLHCCGAFAIGLAYGLPHPTADIAVCEVVPAAAKATVTAIAGRGSALHKKHRVCVRPVRTASLPLHYRDRLIEILQGSFSRIRLFVLEPHDLALSKLARNSDVDVEDVKYLGTVVPLDLDLLRRRYLDEVRPHLIGSVESYDSTIDLWCEAITEQRADRG